ncbi:MAG: hypothetical protein HYX68_10820 [Planctomycetes bacterium]|nr:hypothetical protein [Planctomycetota bacterium]
MIRFKFPISVIFFLALCLGFSSMSATVEPVAAQAKPAAISPLRAQNMAICEFLNQTVDTKWMQEKQKLKNVLSVLGDKLGGKVVFVVHSQPLMSVQTGDMIPDPKDEDVGLQPDDPQKMPLDTVLSLLLPQVASGKATYVVRRGQIEIVPRDAVAGAAMLDERISMRFQERPLHEVLDDLVDYTGVAIILDPQVGKRKLSPITATFRNTLLEDALVAVTESAKLKYVALSSSVFVTTPKKARQIEIEQRKRVKPNAQPKKFRAGAHAQDITPTKFPISVNGGMADRQATKVNDRLHARCLVLDDGATRLALVVCDSCMIPREVTDPAKQLASKATGIPPERILISATHTHTAPTVAGVFQSEPDLAYRDFLAAKIAEGITKANSRLAPARIGWGVGADPTQVFNRRWKTKPGSLLLKDPFGKETDKVRMNPGYLHPDLIEPAGPVDPDISILSVQSPQGKPISLLANYSLHYVGGVPALSADYFAMFANRIATLVGAENADPPFVGIMSNGTSGDINNVNFGKAGPGKRQPGEQARVVAESVAKAAFDAYKKIKHRDWVELKMAQKEIQLGVRLPDEAELKRARAILAAAAEKKVLTKQPEIYARETVLMSKYPKKVGVILQAIRIGDLGIVANPCETFVEIGLDIKKKSPLKHTFTIELANGYNGYLPTPEQHAAGGYETWRARSSYLEVNASRAILATWKQLLKEVAP